MFLPLKIIIKTLQFLLNQSLIKYHFQFLLLRLEKNIVHTS